MAEWNIIYSPHFVWFFFKSKWVQFTFWLLNYHRQKDFHLFDASSAWSIISLVSKWFMKNKQVCLHIFFCLECYLTWWARSPDKTFIGTSKNCRPVLFRGGNQAQRRCDSVHERQVG